MSESLFSRLFPVPRAIAMEGGGLEIAERSIKYLRLAQHRGVRQVAVYGDEPLPSGTIVDGEIRSEESLKAALMAVRARCGFSFAHVSLPEQRGYIFDLPIPRASLSGKESSLSESVLLALPEHVPLSPAESVFDCEVITAESTPEHLATVVTVFPEATAEAYQNVLIAAGFLPLSFELEPQAAARAITSRMDAIRRGAHLLIDIGTTKTLLSVIQNGLPRFTTSVEGSESLDDLLARHLTVGEDLRGGIEKLKAEQGLAQEGSLAETFAKALAPLMKEITRLIVYWNGRAGEQGEHREPLRSIVLYGGNANIKKLADYIAAGAGIPAYVADLRPALTGDASSVPPISRDQSLRYATAVGLALRVEGIALW